MKNLVLFCFFLTMSFNILAQQDYEKGKIITITLSNQEKITGIIESADATNLYLLKGKEKLTIPIKNILYHSYNNGDRVSMNDESGDYREYSDQYFVLPSALPVEKGKIYYRNILLFGNLFSFGVSDNFSVNAGFESVSLFTGDTPIFVITPKVNFPISSQVRVGVGASGFAGQGNTGGFLFGNSTIGSSKNNITLGAGVAWSDDSVSNDPAFYIAWRFALSPKVGVIGEYISTDIIDNDFTGVLDAAIRVNFRGGIALDFGAITTADFEGAIPTVSINIPVKN